MLVLIKKIMEENRIILGLDVSTKCIGISIIEDDGENIPKIIAITHKSPKLSKDITDDFEGLCIKKRIFDDEFLKCINEYIGNKKITDVVIEEALLTSKNAYTVATLLRFNGMIGEAVYNTLGVTPKFISSYDARLYSFPELAAIRKYKKNGDEYPLKHIKDAIKKDNIVLFGSYPFDIDKKTVMLNMVNNVYTGENTIPWELNKKGELKKENYDACDSLVCALAHSNIMRYGLDKPTIVDCQITETENETIIEYTTKVWDRSISKKIMLTKEKISE